MVLNASSVEEFCLFSNSSGESNSVESLSENLSSKSKVESVEDKMGADAFVIGEPKSIESRRKWRSKSLMEPRSVLAKDVDDENSKVGLITSFVNFGKLVLLNSKLDTLEFNTDGNANTSLYSDDAVDNNGVDDSNGSTDICLFGLEEVVVIVSSFRSWINRQRLPYWHFPLLENALHKVVLYFG